MDVCENGWNLYPGSHKTIKINCISEKTIIFCIFFQVVATQIFFCVHPYLREDEPILTFIFFKWVGSTTNQFCRDLQSSIPGHYFLNVFFLTYRVRHGKFEGPNPPPKFTKDSRQFPFRMAYVKGQAVAFSEYTFSERIPYIPTWEEENNLQQRRLVGDV